MLINNARRKPLCAAFFIFTFVAAFNAAALAQVAASDGVGLQEGNASVELKPEIIETGRVSLTVNSPPVAESVEALVAAAEERNPQLQACKAYLRKYASLRSSIGARTNDALNSIFSFKGISTSCEAGDVLLDEKLKLKSIGAAKYAMRRLQDQIELNVLTRALDVIAAIGNERATGDQQLIDNRRKAMEALSGNEPTAKFVACVQSSNRQGERAYSSTTNLDSRAELEQRIQLAVQCAALNDHIVDEAKADIHKYNHHSPAVMALHRIARTTLSVISLAPNVVGPTAQAVLFAYVVVSGGSESSKVLKELYMGKRLECRVATLTEEMHILFDSYKSGVNGSNGLLSMCSEQILGQKIGAGDAKTLLEDADYSRIKLASDQTIDNRLKEAIAARKTHKECTSGTDEVVDITDKHESRSGAKDSQPDTGGFRDVKMMLLPPAPQLVGATSAI